MTADLRRRIEQAIADKTVWVNVDPQAILALLDEQREERHELWTAERRVAELEEGLRLLTDSLDDAPFPLGHKIQEAKRAARALLAAAPSEWRDTDTWRSHGNRPPGDPAALPAEVGE